MKPAIWKVENPISVEQYKEVLVQISDKRKELLQKLYDIEPAIDTDEIADKLGYEGMGGANLQIGTLGKRFCNLLNIQPDLSSYNASIREGGFFIIIHRHYGDYWDMEPNLRVALEDLQIVEKTTPDSLVLDTEISPNEKILRPEGSLIQRWVSRYERDPQAIRSALKIHGNKCVGCAIDFKSIYGDDIRDIIEVHHLYPFKVYGERMTNPETDLIPLCPNCHAVVHSQSKLMTIEELQNRIKKAKTN